MVTCGQGLLPFFMGFYATLPVGDPVAFSSICLTACAATLITTGLYPLTQVYQIDEDLQRGDRSFAAHYGVRKTFCMAALLVGFGMGLLTWLMFTSAIFQRFWVVLLPFGYAAFLVVLRLWLKRFPRQTVYQNHDWSFGVSLIMSGLFWLFLLVEYTMGISYMS